MIQLASEVMRVRGQVTATSRSVDSGDIIDVQACQNTLNPAFVAALIRDLTNGTALARNKVSAFSRSVVATSPFPSSLTSEFRSVVSNFASANVLQLIAVLGSAEGNGGGGNIRTMGFYYGPTASLDLATGTLGGLVNSLNVAKTSAIEVTFQYEITLS